MWFARRTKGIERNEKKRIERKMSPPREVRFLLNYTVMDCGFGILGKGEVGNVICCISLKLFVLG